MRYLIATLCLLFLVSVRTFAQEPEPPGKASFERGLQLVSEERFGEALTAFHEAARHDPDEAAIHANIGKLHLILQQPSDAIPPLRTAVRLAPTDTAIRSDLCIALSLIKDHDAAITQCEEAVKLDRFSDAAHSALFIARKRAGRPTEELLRTIDVALGLLRDSEILLVVGADEYFYRRNFHYAQELLLRLTSIDPENAAYHARLAEVYLRLERDGDALASARRALALDAENPFANYAMGQIFYELGQHHEAIDAFSKVRSSDPRLRWADYYRAVSESRIGRAQNAVLILEELTKQYPDEYEFHFELGSTLTGLARYEDAVVSLTRAVEMRPEDLQSNAALGLALFESAQFEPALRYLNKALETAPGNEIVSMFIRVTRTRQQRVPLIDDMKRYAAANPTEVEVRLSLVQLLAFARRIDEADVYARQLYELNLRDTDVFQRIGVSYGTAGNHSEARRAYEHSLSIKENAAAHLGLTAIYANLGDPDRASASFERVLALKPDSPDVMLLYGRHLMNHGKRRDALEVFKRSLALKPANPVALFNAGILSEKLGEHEAALQYLDALRAVDPREARTLERCISLRILR